MSMAAGEVYALLADGSTVEIRPADPGVFDAIKAMHKAMSPDNTRAWSKLDKPARLSPDA